MMATRSPRCTPRAPSQCATREDHAANSAQVTISSRPSACATRTATRPLAA
jgi:hypothetical protein